MTRTEGKSASAAVKDILLASPDGLREVIRTVLQEVPEAVLAYLSRNTHRAISDSRPIALVEAVSPSATTGRASDRRR